MSLVRNNLTDLKLAIEGTIVMSTDIRQTLDAMYDARLPEKWSRISWMSTTLGFWYTELLERDGQFRRWCYHGQAQGLLGDWLLQPARLPDGHAAGGDEEPQGLGPGQRHLPEPRHQVRQGGHPRLAARGGLHPRLDREDRQAGGVSAQGPLRADARHLHLRHQHDGRQGLQAVRVSHLQEARQDGLQLHRVDRLRERHRTQALDDEGRRAALRHQMRRWARIFLAN
ncbi:unnamed protein product [Sphagnum tenellum]